METQERHTFLFVGCVRPGDQQSATGRIRRRAQNKSNNKQARTLLFEAEAHNEKISGLLPSGGCFYISHNHHNACLLQD